MDFFEWVRQTINAYQKLWIAKCRLKAELKKLAETEAFLKRLNEVEKISDPADRNEAFKILSMFP